MRLKLQLAPDANLDQEQTKAICKFAKVKRSIAWWKMGEGKTRVALGLWALIRSLPQLKKVQDMPCIMVVITRLPIAYDWEQEAQKIGLDVSFRTDFSVSQQKPTVWLVSYGKVPADRILRSVHFASLQMIVVDELHLFGNPKTKRSIAVRRLTSIIGIRAIGLSGSMVTTKDNFKIWGQLWSMNLEKLVAQNATQFREIYQTCAINELRRSGKKYKTYAPRIGWKEKLLARVQDHVSIYMPETSRRTTKKISKFELTSQQKQLIYDLKEHFCVDHAEGS